MYLLRLWRILTGNGSPELGKNVHIYSVRLSVSGSIWVRTYCQKDLESVSRPVTILGPVSVSKQPSPKQLGNFLGPVNWGIFNRY